MKLWRQINVDLIQSGAYNLKPMPDTHGSVRQPALCNLRNTHIVCTGGMSDDSNYLVAQRKSIAERLKNLPGSRRTKDDDGTNPGALCYTISTDSWNELPAMERARKGHASCSMKNWVYVFCGSDEFNDSLNSIERLQVFNGRAALNWEIIVIEDEDLAPRVSLGAVCDP